MSDTSDSVIEPVEAEIDAPPTSHAPSHSRSRRRRNGALQRTGWFPGLSKGARIGVIAGVALCVFLIVVAGVEVGFSSGRVHPGVTIAGVAVGGMSRTEAASTVKSRIVPLLAKPVTVTAGSQQWEITAAQVGASIDASALAQEAYRIGRDSSWPASVAQRLGAWFGRKSVPLAVSADEALMSTFLSSANDAAGTPPVDAAVEVTGTEVTLVPPTAGSGIETGPAREAVLRGFASAERTVKLELITRNAAVSEDGAQRAFDVARKSVSGPLALTYDKKHWSVPAADIGRWLAFRSSAATASAEASSATLECYLDSAEISATVVPLVKEVGKIAKDATFKVSSGKISIVPSQDGLGLDAENLASSLLQTLTGTGERTVELAMKRVQPAITTDNAKSMGIKDRLATYTTTYGAGNKPRVNNIHTLADALDGTLVAPGAVFGFNETIGPRTAEKGYQEANAIVNGKLVPQLGGGVCQMGTTIFNTVFFSGLPVVERHNHSLYISHYPKGRDATVSWGGPDFKFRNDTKQWLFVATSYTSSSVTVSIYGTKPGYDVSYETGPFTNTVAFPVREIKDPTLPKGTKIVEEKGASGRTVVVTRTVKKDGKVIRTDTFKSVYKASEEVVRIGTKVTKPSSPTTTAP